jgi:phosphohistidine phosphatase
VKRLTIVRHAKSSWSDSTQSDSERPLSERGERDAPYMGARLAARGCRPSLIVTSAASRARATARLIAEALAYPQEFLHSEPELYLAAVPALLGVIARQDQRCADLMIVGHNPGLTDLANRLVGDLWLDNLPTAGIVALDCDTDDWAGITDCPVRIAFYDYPKNPEIIVRV